MYEGRSIEKEVRELEINDIEDIGLTSRDSVFAALDAIREHDKQFSVEKQLEMIEAARRDTQQKLGGPRNGEN